MSRYLRLVCLIQVPRIGVKKLLLTGSKARETGVDANVILEAEFRHGSGLNKASANFG